MSIKKRYDPKITWAILAVTQAAGAAWDIWTGQFGAAFVSIIFYIVFMYLYNSRHLKGK